MGFGREWLGLDIFSFLKDSEKPAAYKTCDQLLIARSAKPDGALLLEDIVAYESKISRCIGRDPPTS